MTEIDLPGVAGHTFTITLSRKHFFNNLWIPIGIPISHLNDEQKILCAEFSFRPKNTKVPKKKRALKKYLKKHKIISLLF